jgi:hypothetical protein
MTGPYDAARELARLFNRLQRALRSWGRGTARVTPVDDRAPEGGRLGRTAEARRRFWSELHAGRQLAEANASRGGTSSKRTDS